MHQSDESCWKTYYEHLEGRTPHQLLLDVLARFEAEATSSSEYYAIDLGCGDGTETLALLIHLCDTTRYIIG
jgi:tellurite methyltransferase